VKQISRTVNMRAALWKDEVLFVCFLAIFIK